MVKTVRNTDPNIPRFKVLRTPWPCLVFPLRLVALFKGHCRVKTYKLLFLYLKSFTFVLVEMFLEGMISQEIMIETQKVSCLEIHTPVTPHEPSSFPAKSHTRAHIHTTTTPGEAQCSQAQHWPRCLRFLQQRWCDDLLRQNWGGELPGPTRRYLP